MFLWFWCVEANQAFLDERLFRFVQHFYRLQNTIIAYFCDYNFFINMNYYKRETLPQYWCCCQIIIPLFFNWICFSRATRVCSLTRWWNKLLVMLTPLMSSIVGQQGHIKTIGRFVPSCSWKSTGIWSASIFNSASINNLALTLSSWWPFTHLNPRGSSSTTFY